MHKNILCIWCPIRLFDHCLRCWKFLFPHFTVTNPYPSIDCSTWESRPLTSPRHCVPSDMDTVEPAPAQGVRMRKPAHPCWALAIRRVGPIFARAVLRAGPDGVGTEEPPL